MPNWCENILTVSSNDKETLKKLYDDNVVPNEEYPKSAQLSFNKSVPMPEFPEDSDSWYSWCVGNWGTKWEPVCHDKYGFDIVYECSGLHEIKINLDTAWAPPMNWIEAVSIKYPDLCFELRFADMAMDFSGYAVCEDGDLDIEQGPCGMYFGMRKCEFCEEDEEEYISWDEERRYRFLVHYNCCDLCEKKAFKTIGKFVRDKKIEKLPKKLACMRIGRNAILDNYLMRKVFVPRLNDCVN